MKHRQPSCKRQTIRIKIPPKPAAPRHSKAVARAIPMPASLAYPQKRHSTFFLPIVQVGIASILSATVLDHGECAYSVAFAALGYVYGLVMMAPRREALTSLDE